MSDLTDMMADDLSDVFLNTSDFGIAARYRKNGDGDGDAITIVDGEWTDQLSDEIGGYFGRARDCSMVAKLSTLQTILGRQPQAGDTVEIETGPRLGTWTVVEAVPDAGDAVTLLCRVKNVVDTQHRGDA